MVSFVPRESDLAWRERQLEGGSLGSPPDVAGLCATHLPLARSLAVTLNIDTALERMRELDRRAPAGTGQTAAPEADLPSVPGITAWESILRRALPDFAVEAGVREFEFEYQSQEWCEPMEGLPAGVYPFPWGQEWSLRDAGATVCLWSETASLPSGAIARKMVELRVSPAHTPMWVIEITNKPSTGQCDVATMRFEGDPSPLALELLEHYGLPVHLSGDSEVGHPEQ